MSPGLPCLPEDEVRAQGSVSWVLSDAPGVGGDPGDRKTSKTNPLPLRESHGEFCLPAVTREACPLEGNFLAPARALKAGLLKKITLEVSLKRRL